MDNNPVPDHCRGFENLERELKTHGSTTTPQYNAWYDCFVTKVSPSEGELVIE